jgi:hypothetical protein
LWEWLLSRKPRQLDKLILWERLTISEISLIETGKKKEWSKLTTMRTGAIFNMGDGSIEIFLGV